MGGERRYQVDRIACEMNVNKRDHGKFGRMLKSVCLRYRTQGGYQSEIRLETYTGVDNNIIKIHTFFNCSGEPMKDFKQQMANYT